MRPKATNCLSRRMYIIPLISPPHRRSEMKQVKKTQRHSKGLKACLQLALLDVLVPKVRYFSTSKLWTRLALTIGNLGGKLTAYRERWSKTEKHSRVSIDVYVDPSRQGVSSEHRHFYHCILLLLNMKAHGGIISNQGSVPSVCEAGSSHNRRIRAKKPRDQRK
jgi:hypothetical protein